MAVTPTRITVDNSASPETHDAVTQANAIFDALVARIVALETQVKALAGT